MPAQTYDVPVLVVGAGPAGTVLALELARRNVSSLVVERSRAAPARPKVDWLSARSVELLGLLGFGPRIRHWAADLDGTGDLLWITGLGRAPVLTWRRPAADGVRIPGVALERSTRAAIREHPLVDLREGWTCVDLRREPDGVVATLADADTGVCHAVRSRYLAGCDGADSTVRRCLRIPLDDSSTDTGFCTVYFRSRDPLLHRYGQAYAGLVAPGVTVTSHDSAGSWSAVLAVPADEPLTDPVALLRQRIGAHIAVDQVGAVVQREGAFPVVATYRKGPAFLAGDAAHPFYPAYELGADAAIADAAALAGRLAAALDGSERLDGPESPDGYEADRRPAALLVRELCTTRLQLERRFLRLCAAGLSGERLAGMLGAGGTDPERHGEPATAGASMADPAAGSAGDHPPCRRLAW